MNIILFDGVCNLCNGSVNFVIDRDERQQFKFASLQSEVGQELQEKHHLDTKKIDSILFLENEKLFIKSTAALRVAYKLGGIWTIIYYLLIIIPSPIRDFFYDIIAKNRYKWFGEKEVCRIPTPELKSRFL